MDAQAPVTVPPSSPLVGLGSLPSGFDRFSWAALFSGPLWAVVHGTWWWLGAFLALRVIGIFLPLLGPSWDAVALLGYLVLSMYFAASAHRIYWSRQARLLAERREAGQTIAGFISTQRVLIWIGLAIFALGTWVEYDSRSEWSIPPRPALALVVAFQLTYLVVAAFVAFIKNRGKQPLRG